ncbi:DNA polymerase-4 [Streptomyces sp. SLBN-8D4]
MLMITTPSPRVFDFMFDNVMGEVSAMSAQVTVGERRGVVMHVRCPDRLPEETYRQVLEELAGLSPVVQALPPTAALVDLRGTLGYYGVGACRLGEVLRVRTISRLGVDVRVGIGPTIAVAATASGLAPRPGGVLAVAPEEVAGWLEPLSVEALHGIGPQQAAALRDYGVHCVGLLAAVPPATVQRLLGGKAGRLAADRARGIDPRPVVPRALPATASMRYRFDEHTLDGAVVRAALLKLVVRLGTRLRGRGQVARALTLTLKFAGGSSWEKTRRLTAPSGHEDDLRQLANQLMDAAGLQRGRLTGLILKGEDLLDADQAPRQLSLDDAREARLAAEGAVDRIRDKFGPRVIGPAAVFRCAS